MNYEFYKKNYSGNCVKIAVIDCGIIDNVVNCKKHYFVSKGGTIQETNVHNELVDYHGTYCAQEIKKVAKNAEIYDVNVADENHMISEKRIINALEFILVLGVDIISISMKLDSFSEELINVVEEAYKKGIFILAASDNEVSYPADFKYVLAIQSKPTNVEILHLNKKTVCIGKKEYRYNVDNKVISLEPSASLACAFYAGVLALVLEGSVLMCFEQICERIGIFNYQPEELPKTIVSIEEDTAIIDTSHNLTFFKTYKELLDDNIIGFYDTTKECFLSIKEELLDLNQVKHIMEINFEHYEKQSMANQSRFRNIPYHRLGNFVENPYVKNIKEYEKPEIEFIKYIDKPIIYIAGFASGTQKFETLLQLYQQFTNMGVRIGSMTSNPMGDILGISTYQYPNEITFPNIVYRINETLDFISHSEEAGVLIADIPGGITKLNWHNENNFGMLFKAFLMATDVDIVIIMLNEGILWSDIEKEVQQIRLNSVPNIIFCISELAFDMSTAESETGVQLVKNGHDNNELFYQEVVEYLSGYKVFRYRELLEGELVRYILSLYQQ